MAHFHQMSAPRSAGSLDMCVRRNNPMWYFGNAGQVNPRMVATEGETGVLGSLQIEAACVKNRRSAQ